MTRSDRKKMDILTAAVAEFQEVGYAGARINRIAERADVSKRTLYKHYESKEALFEAIVESVISELQAVVFEPYDPETPLDEQLIKALDNHFSMLSGECYMTMSRIVVAEFLRDQELSKSVFAKAETHQKGLETLLEQAMEAKAMREVCPKYAANQLMSLAKAFLFWPQFLIGEPQPPREEAMGIIKDAVAMFVGHYALGD